MTNKFGENQMDSEFPRDIHFLPLFKDCIFGIVFLHGFYMAHRDIKPNNIMRVNKNEWKLLDYGIGENIKGMSELSQEKESGI